MLAKYNRTTVSRNTGAIVAGAKVEFFVQSTGLPAAIYSDEAGANSLGSSVLSDSLGRIGIFINPGVYRVVISIDGTVLDELTHEYVTNDLATIAAPSDTSKSIAVLANPAGLSWLRVNNFGGAELRTATETKVDLALNNVDNTSDANKPISTATQAALDGKISSSEKGAAGGVATLNASGQIPSIQMPSYVDDVLEATSFSALPATGEIGKIYVTTDDSKVYRWSGTAYLEIVASPGSTDAVPEGSTNLYFTEARVRATPLTGYTLGTNTALAASDTILGATGKIQGQLNAKQPTITGAASTITGTNLTASRALASDASGKVAVSAVTATELGHVAGVTSGIQGQLNGKLAIASNLADLGSAATAFGNIKQAATEAATGVVELADNAEALAGTDAVRAMSPARVHESFKQYGLASAIAAAADLGSTSALVEGTRFLTAASTTLNTPWAAVADPVLNLDAQGQGGVGRRAQLTIATEADRIGFRRKAHNVAWASWRELWHSGNLEKTSSNTDATADRMLKVGDAGVLGDAVMITDWNLAHGSGGRMLMGSNLPNAPIANCWFIGRYEQHNGSYGVLYVTQFTGYTAGNARSFYRVYNNAAWQAWQEVWQSGNFNPDYIAGAGNADGSVTRIAFPKGAQYVGSTAGMTGAIKITLPQLWTSTMMKFRVEIFDYASGESITLILSGYNFSGATPGWVNTSVQLLGAKADRNLTVRFGHDATKACAWIGELASTWDHPFVSVTEFVGGYSGQAQSNWASGWAIGLVTAFNTVQITSANNLPAADYAKLVNVPATFPPDTHSHEELIGGTLSDLNTVPVSSDRTLIYHRYLNTATNKPVAVNNANGCLTMWTHSGPYGKQVAFADDDDLYMRLIRNGSHGAWLKLLHSGHANVGAVANSIAQRDGSGDITCRLIRQEFTDSAATGENFSYVMVQRALGSGGTDNYLRPATWSSLVSKMRKDLTIAQQAANANRTLVLSDAGVHLYHSDATAYTWTIPTNASVAFAIGTTVTFVNDGTGLVTLAGATGVTLVQAGTGATGNRTINQFGLVTALKVGTDRWYISGAGMS